MKREILSRRFQCKVMEASDEHDLRKMPTAVMDTSPKRQRVHFFRRFICGIHSLALRTGLPGTLYRLITDASSAGYDTTLNTRTLADRCEFFRRVCIAEGIEFRVDITQRRQRNLVDRRPFPQQDHTQLA